MIGFDLICLDSSTFSSHERMRRYADKILTPDELQHWELHGENPRNLWRYWALKESAYKIESRQLGLQSLCPKRYEVRHLADRRSRITSPVQHFHAISGHSESCLWAIAGPTAQLISAVNWEIFPLSSSRSEIQSAEVRERLRTRFPHLVLEHASPSGTFLSISHHDTWGGYAVFQQPVS